MKRPCSAVAALLAALAFLAAGPAGADPQLGGAAAEWVASLEEAQRREALRAFSDDERFDLRLAPIGLEGLRRDAMSEAQWQGWRRVLGAALSDAGLRQVETVMSLEREVLRRDGEGLWSRLFGPRIHGEQRYFAVVFGEPGPGRAWGLRFDGHHVSLNWTQAADGRVSTTPFFLGAEPREVPEGWERAGLRALAREEDAARALWEALSPEQRKTAQLEFRSAWGPAGGNRPLFVGGGERLDVGEAVGLARSAMDPAQQAALDTLMEVYRSRLRPDLGDESPASHEALHFAWAGSFTPGEPLYYRLQGAGLLIEFDDTVAEADHVHSIVRDASGDFGRDLLAEHHARHH